MSTVHKLIAILQLRTHRWLAFGIAGAYLLLFLAALQDISRRGRGVAFLTADWSRMFERTGMLTFEPIAQLTLPGLTILVSPLNILMGIALSLLAGLNLLLTYIAIRRPRAYWRSSPGSTFEGRYERIREPRAGPMHCAVRSAWPGT